MEDEEIPYKKRTSSANTQVAKLRKEFEGFRESTAKTLANLRQEIDELKKPAPTAASSEQPYSQPVAVEHTSDPQPPLFHHPQQQTQTLPTQ